MGPRPGTNHRWARGNEHVVDGGGGGCGGHRGSGWLGVPSPYCSWTKASSRGRRGAVLEEGTASRSPPTGHHARLAASAVL